MVDKIKLFQTVQKSYQAIGLDPMQPLKTYNGRIFFIVFSLTLMFISSTAFLIFKAETIQEFATSFYTSITDIFLLVTFFSRITHMGDISKITETFEDFIEKSKCVTMCVQS